MELFGNLYSGFKSFYNGINPATLSGAIDVIVIRQPDGSLRSTPFHVRFGKISLWRIADKVVDIRINGEPVNVKMKIGPAGEAFFVTEQPDNEPVPLALATSPLPEDRPGRHPLPVFSEPELPVGTMADESQVVQATVEVLDTAQKNASLPQRDFLHLPSQHPQRQRQQLDPRLLLPPGSPTESRSDDGDQNLRLGARDVRSMNLDMLLRHMTLFDEHPLVTDLGHHLAVPMLQMQLLDVLDRYGLLVRDQVQLGATRDYHRGLSVDDAESIYDWEWGNLPVRENTATPTPERAAAEAAVMAASEAAAIAAAATAQHARVRRSRMGSPCLPDVLEDMTPAGIAVSDMSEQSSEMGSDAEEPSSFGRSSHDFGSPFRSSAAVFGPMSRSLPSAGIYMPMLTSSKRASPEPGPAMSLCGMLDNLTDDGARRLVFEDSLVSFEAFCVDPVAILRNANLVFRVDGKYYSGACGESMLIARTLYGRPLPETVMEKLNSNKKESKSSWGWWFKRGDTKDVVSKTEDEMTSVATSAGAATSAPGAASYHESPSWQDASAASSPATVTAPPSLLPILTPSIPPLASLATELPAPPQPIPGVISAEATDANERGGYSARTFAKTLYLTSEQLLNLNLKPGANHAQFSFASKFQGKTEVSCAIFLWNWDNKIVISDIDGTITRSDVIGHAAAILGRDWTHVGVAKLYSAIAANGYRFLYLSSRSISHAYATRGYLKGVRQGNSATLPDGPVLLSPESFINSIHREVIARKPEQFKIPCLLSVLELFPEDTRIPGNIGPFVAGFGNRITDVMTYKAVNIPADRIFTIDPKSHVTLLSGSFRTSTYEELHELVDHFFAPLHPVKTCQAIPPITRSFADVSFWGRSQYAQVDLDELEASLGLGLS